MMYMPLERAHLTEDSPLYKSGQARLEDVAFKERLRQPAVLQQWLVWGVQGQMLNARDGRLPPLPPYLAEAKWKLYIQNDPLESFIYEHCERGRDLMVQTTDFKESFDAYLYDARGTSKTLSLQALSKLMAGKRYGKALVRLDQKGYQKAVFRGLRVKEDSPYSAGGGA